MTNQPPPGPGGSWPPPEGQQPYPGGPDYYGQPQYGQPQGSQPQYGQPPYGQAPYGQPQQPYDPGQYQHQQAYYPTSYQQLPPQQPRGGKRGIIIAVVVALVAVLGGGATWFALSQSDSVASGAPDPTSAARNLTTALNKGDLVGLLSALPPAESALFTDPLKEAVAELKRLEVLKPDVDPAALQGFTVKAENLTFDDGRAEQVNDHLTITKLTGGTLTFSGNLDKVPFTEEFMTAMIGEDLESVDERTETETVDIGEQVARNGEPVRIATVNVDGEWYPSLLYTIADYALRGSGENWPAQPIPANGAGSANEAIKQFVQAALDADLRRVVELLPPNALRVLHDAGPVLLDAVSGDELEPSGYTLTDLRTETSAVDGGNRATLVSLELRDPHGKTLTVARENQCYRMTSDGETRMLCANNIAAEIADEADGDLSAAGREAINNLAGGVLEQGVGVITTEVNGKHYVSPLRTLFEQGMTVLRSLQPGDFRALAKLSD